MFFTHCSRVPSIITTENSIVEMDRMLHAYSPVMTGTSRRSRDAENRIHRSTRCRVGEDAMASPIKSMINSPIKLTVGSFLRGWGYSLISSKRRTLKSNSSLRVWKDLYALYFLPVSKFWRYLRMGIPSGDLLDLMIPHSSVSNSPEVQ